MVKLMKYDCGTRDRKTKAVKKNTCPHTNLSTTNPTCTVMASNQVLYSDRPENSLSNAMTYQYVFTPGTSYRMI
jgi:hypothetical protein